MEAAFDFMENAFGNGQEMILFVTELTLMSEAVQFMAQHPCERYLQYNQELLIRNQKTGTFRRIKSIDVRSSTGRNRKDMLYFCNIWVLFP